MTVLGLGILGRQQKIHRGFRVQGSKQLAVVALDL